MQYDEANSSDTPLPEIGLDLSRCRTSIHITQATVGEEAQVCFFSDGLKIC